MMITKAFRIWLVVLLLLSTSASLASATGWESLNPGGGGQVQYVYPDPNTPGRVFFLSDMEGLYRSDNYGASWTNVNHTLKHNMVFVITAVPGQPDKYFLGGMNGLFVSNDGGISWAKVMSPNLPDPLAVAAITIDPNQPDHIYIGHSWYNKDGQLASFNDPDQVKDGPRYVYYSKDGGTTWSKTKYESTDGYKQLYQIATDPANSDIVYLAADAGVYRSTNGGTSFSQITAPAGTSGQSRGLVLSPDGQFIYAVYVDQSDPKLNRLYSAATSTTATAYAWTDRSTGLATGNSNGDDYWMPVMDPRSTNSEHHILLGQLYGTTGLYEGSFAVNAGAITSHAWSLVFDQSGRNGFSYDMGWNTKISTPLVRHYQYTPTSWPTRRLWISNRQTVFEGDPSQPLTSWTYKTTALYNTTNGVDTYQSTGIESTFNNDFVMYNDYMIQAQADNGVVESWNAGVSWAQVPPVSPKLVSNGDSLEITNTTPPLVILGGGSGYGGNVTESYIHIKKLQTLTPNDTWSYAAGGSTNKAGISGTARTYSIAAAPTNPSKVYLGRSNGVFMTGNIMGIANGTGSFWSIGGTALTNKNVRRLEVDPADENILYVLSSAGTYKGVNQSGTWTWNSIHPTAGSGGTHTDMAVWSDGTTTYIALSSGTALYLSSDGGASWETILMNSDIPALTARSWWDSDNMLLQMNGLAGSGNRIFIHAAVYSFKKGYASLQGVIGTDGSVTWSDITGQYSDGEYLYMPSAKRAKVIHANNSDYLFVSTQGSGLWRKNISAVTTEIMPTDDAKVQNGSNANSNYGSGKLLEVKNGSNDKRMSYLKFTVSSASAIIEAKLRLKVSSVSANESLVVSRVNDNGWTEGGIIWNNKPAVSTPIYTHPVVTGDVGTWLTIDVSDYVTGSGVYSFALEGAAGGLLKFDSSESSGNSPVLIITE
ncbi:CBM96 family carbohydrate-binding protein [Paenibacillus sp. strain BS8-2]